MLRTQASLLARPLRLMAAAASSRALPIYTRSAAFCSKASEKSESVSDTSSSGSSSSSGTSSSSAGDKKNAQPDFWAGPKMLLSTVGSIGVLYVSYYFYKANFDVERTEELLKERYQEWPLYPPPGPSQAELITKVDHAGLNQEMMDTLSTWFLYEDNRRQHGVSRQFIIDTCRDVLHLLDSPDHSFGDELNAKCDAAVDDFVARGVSRLLSALFEIHGGGDDIQEKAKDSLIEEVSRTYREQVQMAKAFQEAVKFEPLPDIAEDEADRAVLELELEQYQTELDEGKCDDERKQWLKKELKEVKKLLEEKKK
ncbi:hypothetical protein FOZ63_025850 [Perkinsus olseni]|uniref:Uncharacterized protein n=1 Tax=Perkinsus olseni TaxID=32597 RepID=A0A7J6SHG2_PEROL|nr:hypothetical protein FOZ63_025850 [Perkinsus olseni]